MQEDDGEAYYVTVAHTEEGDVPGKGKDGKCWYSFGGEERRAEEFSYVICRFPSNQVFVGSLATKNHLSVIYSAVAKFDESLPAHSN